MALIIDPEKKEVSYTLFIPEIADGVTHEVHRTDEYMFVFNLYSLAFVRPAETWESQGGAVDAARSSASWNS